MNLYVLDVMYNYVGGEMFNVNGSTITTENKGNYEEDKILIICGIKCTTIFYSFSSLLIFF